MSWSVFGIGKLRSFLTVFVVRPEFLTSQISTVPAKTIVAETILYLG